MAKRWTRAGGMLALVMAGGALAQPAPQPAVAHSAIARPPEIIFAKVCGYCHTTRVGPELRGRALPAAYIAMTVRAGRNAMPAFRPAEISNAELGGLARWLQLTKPPVGAATQGGAR